jgi:N6-adenosine-specific RNA methylase IME4
MTVDLLGFDPDVADQREIHEVLAGLAAIERPLGGFRMLLADNPWLYKLRSKKGEQKSAQAKYKCLPIHVIQSMGKSVALLAATDSIIGMWGTSPMLLQQVDTLHRWGFRYAGLWPWFKGSPNSEGDDPEDIEWNPAFGTGYIGRSCSEFMLIGTRGNPVLLDSAKSERAAFFDPVREHSRKPDDQYRKLEAIGPGPYLEIFSRTDRPGWVHFGNQAGTWRTA